MEKIRAPRGTADIYPPESARWQAFEARARALARRFGYGEIRTPMFESTELFVRGVGETTDIVEKEMYTFTDKGGRSMTLRPEWTAPVVRAMLEHNLLASGPQRLFYVGPFFRYERPQAGRYRQANQFGVECFGFAGPEADVEVIALAPRTAARLRSAGRSRSTSTRSATSVAGRRYREALLALLSTARATSSRPTRSAGWSAIRCASSTAKKRRIVPLVAARADVPRLALCGLRARTSRRSARLLDALGIPFDGRAAASCAASTTTPARSSRFTSDALGAQSTVCGGGRYDGLVRSLGGPATPAVGFGLGIERFLMVLDAIGERRSRRARRLPGDRARRGGARARSCRWSPRCAASATCPSSIDYQDSQDRRRSSSAPTEPARARRYPRRRRIRRAEIVVRDLVARTQIRSRPKTATRGPPRRCCVGTVRFRHPATACGKPYDERTRGPRTHARRDARASNSTRSRCASAARRTNSSCASETPAPAAPAQVTPSRRLAAATAPPSGRHGRRELQESDRPDRRRLLSRAGAGCGAVRRAGRSRRGRAGALHSRSDEADERDHERFCGRRAAHSARERRARFARRGVVLDRTVNGARRRTFRELLDDRRGLLDATATKRSSTASRAR